VAAVAVQIGPRSTIALSIRVSTAAANANAYSRIYPFVLPRLPFRLVRSNSISEHSHPFFWYGLDGDLFCFSPETDRFVQNSGRFILRQAWSVLPWLVPWTKRCVWLPGQVLSATPVIMKPPSQDFTMTKIRFDQA
jgi:hypothetical protein